MTIDAFIAQTRELHGKYKACYLAVMEGEGTYNIEVEIPDHTIAGTYDTRNPLTSKGLEDARGAADVMESILVEMNVKVYATRPEWEDSDNYTSDD